MLLNKVNEWLTKTQKWLDFRSCILCEQALTQDHLLCDVCDDLLPILSGNCYQCGLTLIHPIPGERLCGQCLNHSPQFERTIALWHYEGVIRRWVYQLKFERKLHISEWMGALFAKHLRTTYRSRLHYPECIIPVPLHRKRLQKRGYNQATEIAKPIARILKLPLSHNGVVRIKHTDAQATLSLKQRHRNIKNAFNLKQALPYHHVAILDDVMTTGATANAMAATLKRAGVKRVDVWACARAH